jgi:hypothetical protein
LHRQPLTSLSCVHNIEKGPDLHLVVRAVASERWAGFSLSGYWLCPNPALHRVSRRQRPPFPPPPFSTPGGQKNTLLLKADGQRGPSSSPWFPRWLTPSRSPPSLDNKGDSLSRYRFHGQGQDHLHLPAETPSAPCPLSLHFPSPAPRWYRLEGPECLQLGCPVLLPSWISV